MGRPRNRITELSAIRVLASPLRQEIVDTVEARGGTASVAEIAAELGRSADGLYYHLRLLAKAGLLVELPGKSAAGRDERRYRIVRGELGALTIAYRPREARNRAAVGRVTDSLLRSAGRNFHAALLMPGVVVEGKARELWAGRSKGWVSEKELAAINRLLGELSELMRKKRGAGRDRLISFSYVLAPIEASALRRRVRR